MRRLSRLGVVLGLGAAAVLGAGISVGSPVSATPLAPTVVAPATTLCTNLLGTITYSSNGSCGLFQTKLKLASDTGVAALATGVAGAEGDLSTVNRRAYADDFLHPRVVMLQDVNGNVSYYGWGLKPNNNYAIFTGQFACPTKTNAAGTFAPNTCNTDQALKLGAPRPQVYDMSEPDNGSLGNGTSVIYNQYGIEIDQWGYSAMVDPNPVQGASQHPEMWGSTSAIAAGSTSTGSTRLCVVKLTKAVSLAPASGTCAANQMLVKVGSAPDLSALAARTNAAETAAQALGKRNGAQSLADPRVLIIVDQTHHASFYGWGLLPNHAYGFRTTAGNYCSGTTNAQGRFAANNQVACGSGPAHTASTPPVHTGNTDVPVFDHTPAVGEAGPTHLFNAVHTEADQQVVDYDGLLTKNTHNSVYPKLWMTPPTVTPAGAAAHPVNLCANKVTKVLGAPRNNGACAANQTAVALPADSDLTSLTSRANAAESASTTAMNYTIAEEYLYPRVVLIRDENELPNWYGFGVKSPELYLTAAGPSYGATCGYGPEGTYFNLQGEPGVIYPSSNNCVLQALPGWPRQQSYPASADYGCFPTAQPTCQFVPDAAGNYSVIHYFNDYGIEITDVYADNLTRHEVLGVGFHLELWFLR